MRTSPTQAGPAIIPPNGSALPPGIGSVTDIGVVRNDSGKGYTVTVKGEAQSATIKVSLGKPKFDGIAVRIELISKGAGLTGAAVISPFVASVQVDKLPEVCALTIVNAAGQRIDSRIVTLAHATMNSAG